MVSRCSRSASSAPTFFLFTDTATPKIYTLSLHDALPILTHLAQGLRLNLTNALAGNLKLFAHFLERAAVTVDEAKAQGQHAAFAFREGIQHVHDLWPRSEEHTSELQSRENLVCRLLLEKK